MEEEIEIDPTFPEKFGKSLAEAQRKGEFGPMSIRYSYENPDLWRKFFVPYCTYGETPEQLEAAFLGKLADIYKSDTSSDKAQSKAAFNPMVAEIVRVIAQRREKEVEEKVGDRVVKRKVEVLDQEEAVKKAQEIISHLIKRGNDLRGYEDPEPDEPQPEPTSTGERRSSSWSPAGSQEDQMRDFTERMRAHEHKPITDESKLLTFEVAGLTREDIQKFWEEMGKDWFREGNNDLYNQLFNFYDAFYLIRCYILRNQNPGREAVRVALETYIPKIWPSLDKTKVREFFDHTKRLTDDFTKERMPLSLAKQVFMLEAVRNWTDLPDAEKEQAKKIHKVLMSALHPNYNLAGSNKEVNDLLDYLFPEIQNLYEELEKEHLV